MRLLVCWLILSRKLMTEFPIAATPALLASPQTFYSQLTQSHNQYFLPSYPTLAYGNSTWSPIPLSNYSTLNGATSSSNTPVTQPSSQQPQQQSPAPHSPTAQQQSPLQQPSHPIQPQPPDSTNSQSLLIEYVKLFQSSNLS